MKRKCYFEKSSIFFVDIKKVSKKYQKIQCFCIKNIEFLLLFRIFTAFITTFYRF